jgi:uncharacterized protein (TIGR00255 family)
MTGFASHERDVADQQVAWELKSVNGKSLDIRLRIPAGLEGREPALKERIKTRVARGTVYANLSIKSKDMQNGIRLSEGGLDAVWQVITAIHLRTGASLPNAAEVASMKGVIDWTDTPAPTQDEKDTLFGHVLDALDQALDAFCTNRAEEGARLAEAISGQIDRISDLTQAVRNDPSRQPGNVIARLEKQLEALQASDLPHDRLMQEASLLATKADIAEEVDRLDAHVAAARDLLTSDAPVGRRFDFLAQEFAREANTICSKSSSTAMSEAGVDLKVTIDQMREQAANLE